MIKKIIVLIAFLLLITNVDANPFATIAMNGISFVNLPNSVSTIINAAICVSNPLSCVQGKIVGQVSQTALNAIYNSGEIGRKAVNALNSYNQVKGYVDQGAQILSELKVDEDGFPEDGEIKGVAKSGENIGNLFGLKKENVYGKDIRLKFNREKGYNHAIFENDKAQFKIKNERGEKYYFENIQTGYITLDLKGNIVNADLIVGDINKNQKTIYRFTQDGGYSLSSGQRIAYNNGNVRIYKNKEDIDPYDSFEFFYKNPLKGQKLKILGDYVEIEGNEVRGNHFLFNGAKVDGLNGGLGKIIINPSSGKIEKIIGGTNVAGVPFNKFLMTVASYTYGNNQIDYNVYGNDLVLSDSEDTGDSKNFFSIYQNKIVARGSGFTVGIKSNLIYPKINLKMEMLNDANLQIASSYTLSRLDSPFGFKDKLNIYGKGNFNLINGNYKISSQDDNVYAKIINENEDFDMIPSSINIQTKNDIEISKTRSLYKDNEYELTEDVDQQEKVIRSLKSIDNPDTVLNFIPQQDDMQNSKEGKSLLITFKRAKHIYKGQEYNVGKDLKGPLDVNFYDRFVKESAKYNIDPYWASAITVAEYAGYRKANYAPNFIHYALTRGYIPVGYNIADFRNPDNMKLLKDNLIKVGLDPKKLDLNINLEGAYGDRAMQVYTYKGEIELVGSAESRGLFGSAESRGLFKSPLDIISFTSGKILQDQALSNYNNYIKKGYNHEEALSLALQAYHGYGYLDFEDKKRYPHIKGSQFPVYGQDLKEFINTLKNDPTFNAMVKKYNAKTPITDKILNNKDLVSK